jgi:hypothetical protein
MECWVHHDAILDDDQANQLMKEDWEHDDSKDELKIDLQGLERHFWLGTEAGRLGCYHFPGETWAGNGSVHKGVMGAGSVCLQQQSKYLEALQATPPRVDLLYLCDSETALQKVSWWIGSGPRTTLAGDANDDIMTTIVECVRERVMRGARTFMVKVKSHQGEPLNERAGSHAENARQLPPECRQWTTRTSRMTYEWSDKGVAILSVSKASGYGILRDFRALNQKTRNRFL